MRFYKFILGAYYFCLFFNLCRKRGLAGRYHVSFIAIHLRLDLRSPNSIYWMRLQLKISAGYRYAAYTRGRLIDEDIRMFFVQNN